MAELPEYSMECMAYIGRGEASISWLRDAGLECYCVLAHPNAALFVWEEVGANIAAVWGVPVVLTKDVGDMGDTCALTFADWVEYLCGEELVFFSPQRGF